MSPGSSKLTVRAGVVLLGAVIPLTLPSACGDSGTDTEGPPSTSESTTSSEPTTSDSIGSETSTESTTDGPAAEICDDGEDNDNDGAIDCDDSDCADALTCPIEVGAHVATVELVAPESETFTLRATIPIPEGVFPRPDGRDPFGIMLPDGEVVPAQVQQVSRYPGGDADVVELIARVWREPGPAAARIQYDVYEYAHPQPEDPDAIDDVPALLASGPTPVPDELAAMLSEPGAIQLRSRDAFDHEYTRDLLTGAPTLMRHGTQTAEVRTHGTLVPDQGAPLGPPDGALSHLYKVRVSAIVAARRRAPSPVTSAVRYP